jgi:integrase/recombinase XerD
MPPRQRPAPLPTHAPTGMQLYDAQGHRLYLTASERDAFRKAAEKAPREVRTYCHTLLYTGCRPSEALALTADRVDFQAQAITFESKKKRRPGIYRAVPVPDALLEALHLVHGIRDRKTKEPLWPKSWRRRASQAHRPAPRDYGMVSALPASKRAFP